MNRDPAWKGVAGANGADASGRTQAIAVVSRDTESTRSGVGDATPRTYS